MWVRDQLGEWHRDGGRRAQPQSVVYTRRGQPRSVTLMRDADRERGGTATACGRTVDPRNPHYERAPAPDPGDPLCRACREAPGAD